MMFVQQGRRQIRHRVRGDEVIGRARFGKIVNVNAVFLPARIDRQQARDQVEIAVIFAQF